MKRLLIAVALLSLSACGDVGGGVQSAGTIATVDNASKKTVTAAADLYRHASAAGEKLVKQGLLSKAAFKAADAKAFAVLIEVEAGRATLAQLATATAALTGAK